MVNFKVVMSDPASKKAYQKEIESATSGLMGKKVGEKISGDVFGLAGYELEITGGSDKDGFPMRRDVDGTVRKKIILASPPGYHPTDRGKRKRKSIRGNIIADDISQINVKIVKSGPKKIEELFGKKEEGKTEDKGKAEEAKHESPKHETDKKTEEAKPERAKSTEEKKTEVTSGEKEQEKAEAKMGVKSLEEAEKKSSE